MLEPLALSALTSVLCVRPLAASYSLSQPALRMVARPASSTLPQDFFTPYPRRAKGKERAVTSEGCGVCRRDMSGGECVGNLATTSSVGKPFSPLPDTLSARHKIRRLHTQKPFSESPRARISSLTSSCKVDATQRRHASSQPQPAATSVSEPQFNRGSIFDFIKNGGVEQAEAAWLYYEELRQDVEHFDMNPTDHILFARRLATHVRRVSPSSFKATKELSGHWGTRLRTVLLDLGPRLAPDLEPWHRHLYACLTVCAHAQLGELDEAISLVRTLRDTTDVHDVWQTRYYLEACTTLVHSIRLFHGATHVLDFVLEELTSLEEYLLRPDSPIPRSISSAATSFRTSVLTLLCFINKPAGILVGARKQKSPEWRQKAGELLITAICNGDPGLAHDGLALMQELLGQGLIVPDSLQLSLVKSLANTNAFEAANALFQVLSNRITEGPEHLECLRTGLHLYSHQGNAQQTEHYVQLLESQGELRLDDIANHIYVHARRGKPIEAEEVYEQYFGPSSNRTPNLVHLTNVFFAYSGQNDWKSMNRWLEKMHNAGLAVDGHVYSIILENYASHGDLKAVKLVMERMRLAGVAPTPAAYTSILTLLARLKDPATAEIIFRRAVSEGVVPDRMMITTLMNVHVESGSWKGVIHIFDYLSTTARRYGIRLTIEVYNTLLKAYILIGAPFRVVSAVFQQIESANIRPDARTFSLLIQSACDAGRMKVAADLFAEMERLARRGHATLQINVYVLTIMMAAYLRLGDKVRAKAIYDDMLRRGIQPNAVTLGAIIKAYSSATSPESIQIAENFIQTIMQGEEKDKKWMQNSRTTRSAHDHIYGPLITAYNLQEKPEEVERVLRQLADTGVEPSLGNLTAMLDVYRRTGNIDGLRELWPRIHELGSRQATGDSLLTESEQPAPRKGQILCVPLSIYIDALSSAGYHEGISLVWKQLKSEGFVFDSHNWNHLAVALVRAGEPERAFEVLEKVILPYRRLVLSSSVSREHMPTSPLITDLPPSGKPEAPTAEAPMHSRIRRSQAVRLTSRKSKQLMEQGNPDDFAHNLHTLYQISPAWSVWRPHGLILTTLSDVLAHMRAGKLVQAIRPGEDVDFRNAVRSRRDIEERSRRAEETLSRIYTSYPHATRAVRDYENWQRVRPGGKKYRRSI